MKDLIGQKLIKLDLLSFEQAEIILEYQQTHKDMKFGDIAVALGFMEKETMSREYHSQSLQ